MNLNRSHRPFASIAARIVMSLAALLAACGGSDPAPEATEVAAGQRAQAAIGTGGGTVELATREGARLTLTVPAGAVPEGTVLGLETAQAAAGRRLHLRLAPAGLLPAQPLLLTVALPASLALPTGATLAYDRGPVPVTRLADGALQVRLNAFATTSTATSQAGRARALSARALAGAPANPCAGAPALDGTPEGGLADTAPIDADVYGSCMLGAVNALAQSGEFAEAVRLASTIGAYLQSIGAANTDNLATRYIVEARTLACTAYGQALETATNTPVTAFDTPTRLIKPVLFWEATIQRLGASCPGIAPTRYVEVVEQLTGRGLGYFAGRQGQVVDVASPEYAEAVGAVRAAPQAVAQVRSMQAPPAVQTLAQAQLQQRAQPAIVDAVLQAPWQRCSDSGLHDKLMELMVEGGSPEAVKTAAQYCGTLLQVQARAANGSVLATLTPSLGGVAAGNQRTSGSIDVTTDGTLVLDGPIRALQCPAGSTGGTESLELKLGNTVLQTLAAAPYLATSLTIDIAAALRAAGINADSFTGGTLTIRRTGNPCGGFWGTHPEPLLTLELQSGRSVVLVSLDDGPESPTPNYRYYAEYERLLASIYGQGRVTRGQASDGAALFRSGRDVVLVNTDGNPSAFNLLTSLQPTMQAWLNAGGRLLLQGLPLGTGAPFGIGVYMPGPGGGQQRTFTVSWAGGRFSVADSVIGGIGQLYPVPYAALADLRVTGFDVSLITDDDQSDAYTDDPVIFPVNYDNVGQGEPVAARRNVGQGRVVVTTLVPPWAGYAGALDPAYQFILRDLRGQ